MLIIQELESAHTAACKHCYYKFWNVHEQYLATWIVYTLFSSVMLGPGLALKGKVFPNHSVIRRDPSVIGEDDDALYCVTDDINCCGTPPTSNDENGGSGNGRGYWYFPTPNSMPTKPLDSGTDNTFRWYARWLTGAVLMNFRGLATTGTSNLHYCEIQDSAGTLHQFYTCIFAETGTNIYSCKFSFTLHTVLAQ